MALYVLSFSAVTTLAIRVGNNPNFQYDLEQTLGDVNITRYALLVPELLADGVVHQLVAVLPGPTAQQSSLQSAHHYDPEIWLMTAVEKGGSVRPEWEFEARRLQQDPEVDVVAYVNSMIMIKDLWTLFAGVALAWLAYGTHVALDYLNIKDLKYII